MHAFASWPDHLGNTYGKAGVNSRHQLTAMARKDPQLFGISLRR